MSLVLSASSLFAQSFDAPMGSEEAVNSAAATGFLAGTMLLFFFVYAAVILIYVVSMWKLYAKAGKPGWASIVPIYNVIVQLEIIGRPIWWILLLFIPFVNIYAAIVLTLDLAKSYGKDTGFGILMLLFPIIMMPVLAFGKSEYVGPAGKGSNDLPGLTPPTASTSGPTATPSAPAAPTASAAQQSQPSDAATPPQNLVQ